jgi:hypothetical protein
MGSAPRQSEVDLIWSPEDKEKLGPKLPVMNKRRKNTYC